LVSLGRYVGRRILFAIPTFFGVLTFSFVLIHLAPGDPVSVFIGQHGSTPEYVAFLRAKWGLDKPLLEQYIIYVKSMLQGDLGYSMFFNRPVTDLLGERIPATLLLAGAALIISSAMGMLLGVVAARRAYGTMDGMLSAGSMVFYSMPIFWLAQNFLLVFSLYLNLLPTGGMMSLREEVTGLAYFGDILLHVAGPALVLGLAQTALVFRMTRAGMLEVLKEDYITTARAKGLTETLVTYKHALKNVLTLVLTVVALNFSGIVGGVVLTETIFSWPGLGRLVWQAAAHRDYPLLLGTFIFISGAVITVNLIVDIMYAAIDPRVRYR
jgi:peptide/nickel transport system permease protein